MGIILIVKALVWLTMKMFKKPLQFFGENLLIVFEGHPQLELVFVMIIIPFISNSIVLWITDSFLKNDKETEQQHDFELLPENKSKALITDMSI